MSDKRFYTVIPQYLNSQLADITIDINDKQKFQLIGTGGKNREISALQATFNEKYHSKPHLPVLLGSGFGFGLEFLLEKYLALHSDKSSMPPLAIVDAETEILKITKLQERFAFENITWIIEKKTDDCLKKLTEWQEQHGNLPLLAYSLPSYQRLNRQYYKSILNKLEANWSFDFWAKIKYPKFNYQMKSEQNKARILLLTCQYFLIGEIEEACQILDIPYKLLHLKREDLAQSEFIERLLTAVVEFKPDFIITLNHLGVDREGILNELLSQLELPLVSWFVDNPHLILYHFKNLSSPWVNIFSWDHDNLKSLSQAGFKNVHYLPLATSSLRYKNIAKFKENIPKSWFSDVSFVGNSMVYKVAQKIKIAHLPKKLLLNYKNIASGFAKHEERFVYEYLKKYHQELLSAYDSLEILDRKLAFETMITWEATKQYRASCLKKILPFEPLILGDKGWKFIFKNLPDSNNHSTNNTQWHWHPEISYYSELPYFYQCSKINFNCTSQQMKGAVNQRVFDVPMVNGFVLSDYRAQMETLFELDREAIVYSDIEEIPDLIKFYLKNQTSRQKIINAAKERILKEHTYCHRLKTLIKIMQQTYS